MAKDFFKEFFDININITRRGVSSGKRYGKRLSIRKRY